MFHVFNDLVSFIASTGLVIGYHLYLRLKLRGNPHYTIQAVNRSARTAWVMRSSWRSASWVVSSR